MVPAGYDPFQGENSTGIASAFFIGRVAARGNRVNISDILIALSSISSTGENRRDAGSHVIARYSGIEIRISNHMVDSATGESVNPEIPGR
jgi:hypothetical protein